MALVEDRYRHRPHLDLKYRFLFRKPLNAKLEEGSRALYMWLSNVAKLSSISTKPTSQERKIRVHTKFQHLSDADLGRLRRLRVSHVLSSSGSKPNSRTFALGVAKLTTNLLLPAMWNIVTKTTPTPLVPPRSRRKNFKRSIHSSQATKIWDRGRTACHMT